MNNPQSWYDLPLMNPMDPRAIIASITLQDNTAATQVATFENSTTFLKNTTWAASPLTISTATPGVCVATAGAQDYEGFYLAQQWTNSHGVVSLNSQIPPSVQKIAFLKAAPRFLTSFGLTFAGGVTSTDIQISLRDNSATGGSFIDSSSGTIPAFVWNGPTFGGVNRLLTVQTVGPGRAAMAIHVVDNSGNWSIFEMDWIVVP